MGLTAEKVAVDREELINDDLCARVACGKTRPPSSAELAGRLRSTSHSLAIAIILLAAVVLIGRLGRSALPPLPEPIILTTGSAWLLLLTALSLWLRDSFSDYRWRLCSKFSTGCLIGLTSAAIAHFDGRYQQIEGVSVPWSAVRVMSPQSVIAFLLLGISLLLLDWETPNGARPAQAIALCVAGIALTSLLGYLYSVPSLYVIDSYPPVSIQESIALLLLGVAVLFARPDRGLVRIVTSDTAGGFLARRTPAAVIAFPMASGWLVLKGQRWGWYDVSAGISIFVLANIGFFALLIFRVARTLDRADLQRTRAEEQLRLRACQRAHTARLGQQALSGAELVTLMEEGVRLVINGLEVQSAEFLEVQDDGLTLIVKAGIGGPSDPDTCTLDASTLPGQVLASRQPMIINGLGHDRRFHEPRLEAQGIVSAVLVAVYGATRAYGVLAAYSTQPRPFSEDDVHLLQTVAGILAAAHERKESEGALRLSEEKFSGVFRASPDAITVSRLPDGRLLEVNDGFLQMTGFSRDEVIDRPASDLRVWTDPPAEVAAVSLGGRTSVRNVEIQFHTKGGEMRVGLCSTQILTLGGEPCLLTVVRDVSERKRVQSVVQEANERLARWVNELEIHSREISLLNDMGDLLQSCLTPDEACGIAVQFAQELLPRSSGAICLFGEAASLIEVAAAWGDILTGETMFAPEDCWALRRGRLHSVSDPGSGLVCAHVRQPLEGAYVCVPMMAQGEALGILHARDPESDVPKETLPGSPTGSKQKLVVAIAEHVALALANIRLRQSLRNQSVRDQLTGLHNRRYMEESLNRELLRCARAARPIGLVLVDLDRFKTINDSFGHEAGDELLRAVGQLFRTHLRADDIVCRYGGEEFLFAMPETTQQGAVDRADEIRGAVKSLTVWHRGRLIGPVSVSAGVVASPDHGGTTGDLLLAADAALYRAKANGGDRVEIGSGLTASRSSA